MSSQGTSERGVSDGGMSTSPTGDYFEAKGIFFLSTETIPDDIRRVCENLFRFTGGAGKTDVEKRGLVRAAYFRAHQGTDIFKALMRGDTFPENLNPNGERNLDILRKVFDTHRSLFFALFGGINGARKLYQRYLSGTLPGQEALAEIENTGDVVDLTDIYDPMEVKGDESRSKTVEIVPDETTHPNGFRRATIEIAAMQSPEEPERPLAQTRNEGSRLDDSTKAIRRSVLLGHGPESQTLRELIENQAQAFSYFERFRLANPNYENLDKVPERAQIIEDIRSVQELYNVDSLIRPAPLDCAIPQYVLECILDQHWWEALNSMSISREGRHFTFTTYEHEEEYRRLVACARLLGVGPEETRNLFRNDYFRSDKWKAKQNRDSFQAGMWKYQCSRPSNEYRYLDYSHIPEDPTLAELQEGIIKVIGPEKITEIIRLCVNMQAFEDDPRVFSRAIVRMGQALVEENIDQSVVIVERSVKGILDRIADKSGHPTNIVLAEHTIVKPDAVYEGITSVLLVHNRNVADYGPPALKIN